MGPLSFTGTAGPTPYGYPFLLMVVDGRRSMGAAPLSVLYIDENVYEK